MYDIVADAIAPLSVQLMCFVLVSSKVAVMISVGINAMARSVVVQLASLKIDWKEEVVTGCWWFVKARIDPISPACAALALSRPVPARCWPVDEHPSGPFRCG